MRWLKKWAYIILFLGTGLFYLACVDHWQVYAESLNRLKSWYQEFSFVSGGKDNESGNSVSGGSADHRGQGGGTGTEAGREEGESAGSEGSGQENASGNGPEGSGEAGPSQGQEGGNGPEGPGEASPSQGQEDGNGPEGSGDAGPSQGQEGGNGSGDGPAASGDAGPSQGQEDGDGEPKTAEYITVEDDYFSDALFIGDSRTVGMFEYGGLEEIATFYASKGLTIFRMFDSQIVPSPEGKISVEEGLQQNSFSKIYLMIGINEMGTGTVETFLEKYRESVEHLKELQPEAVIYVQAIIKVTSERSAKGDYINNEGIEARNEGIALLADNERVFYLDVNPLICDDSGGMDPSYTFDGVHLKGKYIEIWKDYLKTHAISP